MSAVTEKKCPKCGKTDFLVKVSMDMSISSTENSGTIVYNFIESIKCQNPACLYELDDTTLQKNIISKAQSIIGAISKKDLIIK